MLRLKEGELSLIATLLKSESGISLDDRKGYLLETRLSDLAEKNTCTSYKDLVDLALKNNKIRNQIVDALTTNETSFFRDSRTFDMLINEFIPDHYTRLGTNAPLRILSAACSTGQEVYTIAIVLREMFGDLSNRRITIVGVDISDSSLEQASKGEYSQLEIRRGIDDKRRDRFFKKQGDRYIIDDSLRGIATFKKLNLLDPSSVNRLGSFDLAFCRNVAIYFEEEDRKKLFMSLAKLVKPSGMFLLGLTEVMRPMIDCFEKQSKRGVGYYVKSPTGSAACGARPSS